MFSRLFYLLSVIIAIKGALAQTELQRHFDFEDALNDLQQNQWMWRSEASNEKTLRLVDPIERYSIDLLICVEPLTDEGNVTFYVDDVRYSNDGPSDTVTLRINGAFMGMFETVEKWRSGHEWNVFRNSGQVGDGLILQKGEHTLTVQAATDQWGIELDRVRVNVENQDPNKSLFCGASLS